MPKFFVENGVYIETLTDVLLADRLAGSEAVSQRPSADHQWQGGAWVYVAPIVDLPTLRATMLVTRYQMITALKNAGFISPTEARAAAKGDVPAAVAALFDQLTEPDQTDAYARWSTFTEAHRTHPLVAMLAQIPNPPLTDEQMDDFFTAAALL